MKNIFWIVLFLFCTAAQAGEVGYLVRAIDLKAKPFIDADTVAKLPERTKVEVLQRQSSWMQIKAQGGTGWVKMLSVRLGIPGAVSKGDGGEGLGNVFNLATTGKSGSTVTTGVRGLSEENLKNPTPNPEAYKTMQAYAANKAGAQSFAQAGALRALKVEYLDAGKAVESAEVKEPENK